MASADNGAAWRLLFSNNQLQWLTMAAMSYYSLISSKVMWLMSAAVAAGESYG
jgi:hypothetical protein